MLEKLVRTCSQLRTVLKQFQIPIRFLICAVVCRPQPADLRSGQVLCDVHRAPRLANAFPGSMAQVSNHYNDFIINNYWVAPAEGFDGGSDVGDCLLAPLAGVSG